MMVGPALALLAFLSLALNLWQYVAGRRFKLHERRTAPGAAPPVSIFKPLKGLEPQSEECLRSWLAQEYPGETEVLFGVDSLEDPIAEVAGRLVENSRGKARLIVCQPPLALHPKVSKLMHLLRGARHDVMVISDADVRVDPDLLANAIPPLEDPQVGMVNCFYTLANPHTAAMHWPAIAINADFWTQVLQSLSLKPQDFALGAVMITRRQEIEGMGGFEAITEYLADDYQLGNRIARQGKRIVLTPVVAECVHGPMTWRDVWRHQLRQARTIRACQAGPYFASVLNNATFWPLLWLIAQPQMWVLASVLGILLLRVGTALLNQRKLTRSWRHVRSAWMIPVKDLLQMAVWAGAFTGNTVEWRGERYRIRAKGKLERITARV